MIKLGLVANEESGDLLGAALLEALHRRQVALRCVGVAGRRLAGQQCESLVPLERLSVMGLFEVLRHLPELLRIRRRLTRHFLRSRPDLFIGVDAPDFNLGLEARLRRQGIKTLHYVCPSVWAWRSGRVRKLREAACQVLCLFPFEAEFLRRHQVPATYVGHPLADRIAMRSPSVPQLREQLGVPADALLLALLPGSRMAEVARLAGPFLEAARLLQQDYPSLHVLVPLVNERIRARFQSILERMPAGLPQLHLFDGQSDRLMMAADLVLTASGTASLEALLHHRPMVVGYRVNPLSWWLARWLRLIKISRFALPNILVAEDWVPELIQQDCTADRLHAALRQWLTDPRRCQTYRQRARQLHQQLRCDAAERAADAVLQLLAEPAEHGS